jgi:hypothetical protein
MTMDVPLQGPRFTLEHTADGIRASVPSRKNWFVIIFLGIWLCGWFAGESSTLLWQVAGREIISVNSLSLIHRVEALGIGRSRSVSVNAFQGYERWGRTGLPFGVGGAGSLVFDYGARTIRMLPGLDEAEAKMLVKEFSTRLKG